MTTYLHIGSEKAGSTFLQNTLARVASESPDLIYPALPGPNHYLLPLAVAAGEGGDRLEAELGVSREHAREMVRSVLAGVPRDCDLFLSCELLSSRIRQSSEISDLADLLAVAGEDVRVLLIVRRLDDAIRASVSEMILQGWDRFDYLAMPFEERFDYHKILERWEAAFGPESVTLVPYYEDWREGDDVVAWVANATGYSLPIVPATWSVTEGRRSKGSQALSFLREFNARVNRCFEEITPEGRTVVLAVLGDLFVDDSRMVLPPGVRRKLFSRSLEVEVPLLDSRASNFSRERFLASGSGVGRALVELTEAEFSDLMVRLCLAIGSRNIERGCEGDGSWRPIPQSEGRDSDA